LSKGSSTKRSVPELVKGIAHAPGNPHTPPP
jgi:hypothetical protein